MTDEQVLKAMQSMLEPIKKDLSGLKQDMTEVKGRVTKIELVQENKTNKNIQLLLKSSRESMPSFSAFTKLR